MATVIPYPPTHTIEQAASIARARLGMLRGSRRAGLELVLSHYAAGRNADAMTELVPWLRYNPTTEAANATSDLYAAWRDQLMPEGLEPLLFAWNEWCERPALSGRKEEVRCKRFALGRLKTIVSTLSALAEGRADHPFTAWLTAMTQLGTAPQTELPSTLWRQAVDLALHIARTRLRNPNIAPKQCLGRCDQSPGRDVDRF